MKIPTLPLGEQLRLRENRVFLALTILLGVFGGLSAVLFALSIDVVKHFLFGSAPGPWRLVAVPTVVSLVTGWLLWRFFDDARGSGIPQTEAAYHLHDGVIRGRVVIGKFLTGVLCVGSGHSMGREGPSVQIGAGIASVLARWFRLPSERVRSLVPVGAAAALSAAFNTPVAAVVFALEEIIGDMNAPVIGSTVVASVTAVIVERSILGSEPLFRVPAYRIVHPAELFGYAVLGVVGGIVSVVFCKGLLRARLAFRSLPRWSRAFQPALGGLAIGLILLVVPQVMGVGYEHVDAALDGGLALRMLLLLCAVKLAATVISYASGNAGGIFAPSLFLGAMTGGAVGFAMNAWAPFPTGDSGAYALVGMGTLFAGILRVPMTSVLMVFEMTQDYQTLVPLMVANMLAFLISRHYQKRPIYHALLEQDGIHLPGEESRLRTVGWTARDLMVEPPLVLAEESTVEEAWRRVESVPSELFLVGEAGSVAGLVGRAALDERRRSGGGGERIRDLLVPLGEAVHVHADHSLELTFDRLRRAGGFLPVVSRSDERRVEGVVTRESVGNFLGAKASS